MKCGCFLVAYRRWLHVCVAPAKLLGDRRGRRRHSDTFSCCQCHPILPSSFAQSSLLSIARSDGLLQSGSPASAAASRSPTSSISGRSVDLARQIDHGRLLDAVLGPGRDGPAPPCVVGRRRRLLGRPFGRILAKVDCGRAQGHRSSRTTSLQCDFDRPGLRAVGESLALLSLIFVRLPAPAPKKRPSHMTTTWRRTNSARLSREHLLVAAEMRRFERTSSRTGAVVRRLQVEAARGPGAVRDHRTRSDEPRGAR